MTAPGERRVPGVRVRRGHIDRPDRATHRGIPITAVPRTLIDLAAELPLDALARACHEAGVRYRTTPADLRAALDPRPPNTPGAAKLKRIVEGDVHVTLGALELPLPHSRHAWEQDRRRERDAGAHGDDFRRYTWADVFEEPARMLAELRTALG